MLQLFYPITNTNPGSREGDRFISGAALCSTGACSALGWARHPRHRTPLSLPTEQPHRLPTAPRSGNRTSLYGQQLLAGLRQRWDQETVPAPGLHPPKGSPGPRLPAQAVLSCPARQTSAQAPHQPCLVLRPEEAKLKPGLNQAAKAVSPTQGVSAGSEPRA